MIKLYDKHPEAFSEENTKTLVKRVPVAGAERSSEQAYRCDVTFTGYFPQYKGYEGEELVHHHIGEGRQAVAMPVSLHQGHGGIHAFEQRCGMTEEQSAYSLAVHEAISGCDPKDRDNIIDKVTQTHYADKAQVTDTKLIVEKMINAFENKGDSLYHERAVDYTDGSAVVIYDRSLFEDELKRSKCPETIQPDRLDDYLYAETEQSLSHYQVQDKSPQHDR